MTTRWNNIIEHAIIGHAVSALIDEGYRVEMSDQDGGGLFAYAWQTEKRPAQFSHWIKFVLGNGVDVLVDHTMNLEAILKDTNAFAAQWMD